MENSVIKENTVKSRAASFLIIFLIYLLTFVAGFFTLKLLNSFNFHILVSFFIADITATIIVWILGIIFNNSSVYDPYWSVAPIVILPCWMIEAQVNFSAKEILFLAAIVFWGLRLTYNWARRWKGFGHQDWRYTMLKAKSPKMWFLTNLIGINIMPTLFVYMALMPAYFAIEYDYQALPGTGRISAITAAGFIICISSVVIQAISDRQMDNFRRRQTETEKKHIDMGLWRYSRHPNYFGEVFFWWGIWIMQIGITPKIWATIFGPIAMTLLFIFISIPMMEKYIVSSKPSYEDYKKKVSMLIPWPRFKL